MPHLVRDRGPERAHLVRLPQHRRLLGQRALDRGALGRRRARVVERVEQAAEAQLALQERAPRGLRRVRRQHGLEQHAGRPLAQLPLADAGGADGRERGVQALGARAVLPGPQAQAADAVVLLGEVRQHEVEGERADDHRPRVPVDLADRAPQRRALRLAPALARRARQQPHVLDRLQQLGPLLLGERGPERRRQEVDVAPQRLERVAIGHRPGAWQT